MGTALGSQLGNLAARLCQPRPRRACAGRCACPVHRPCRFLAAGRATAPPVPTVGSAAGAPLLPDLSLALWRSLRRKCRRKCRWPRAARPSSVTGGSAAAAQGLVLSQQPEVLRSLLATALGQHGRQQVSGVPVAQLLTLFSQVIGQAAADADQLMYLEQQPDAAESAVEDVRRVRSGRSTPICSAPTTSSSPRPPDGKGWTDER